VASQSGHHTNIVKRRLGCRLPFEQGKDDGYASSGPVVEYSLPPEEITKKYGPVNESVRSITAKSLEYAIDKSNTPVEAAKFLKISIPTFWQKIEEHGITTPGEWEDEKPMIPETDTRDKPETNKPETNESENTSKKTQIETAREKLTKEVYLEFKAQGLKDAAIIKRLDISNVNFYKIKKEFGQLESDKTGLSECSIAELSEFDNTDSTDHNQDPAQSEITWITKDLCYQIPTVKIGSSFRFNAASRKLIAADYVKVGVVSNRLIIAPCQEKDQGCYKLNHGKHSAAIGGDRLLRVIQKLGITPGRYQLTKNDQGWWVGELMV